MGADEPIQTQLLLIGGGHSHALVLRDLAMNPMPGVSVTLISDRSVTPYSGMLPGFLAGHYSYDDCHIDLRHLMNAVQGQLIVDRVIGIDPQRQRIPCAQHPALRYDWLSIDIGSTPVIPSVPGSDRYGLAVKPWQPFLEAWADWTTALQQKPPSHPPVLVIVGGGAGGVEVALNADQKFAQILGQHHPASSWSIHIIQRGEDILPGHNRWVQQRCRQILAERSIQVHCQEHVSQVHENQLICQSGLTLGFDQLFWVTGATAPAWLSETGLALTETGFIAVNEYLQSLSHANIFAAGDVATLVQHPRPKAGVFAVRQGKPLSRNLRLAIQGKSLEPFMPQKNYLSLIGTGDERAIASWGNFPIGFESDWLWRLKDRIDRQFMDQFDQISSIPMATEAEDSFPVMHCAGCGSKVGGSILSAVLAQIQQETSCTRSPDILIGLEGEDAAVVSVPPGQVVVQTVDYFRQLINDPYQFGQVATHHALSDLYAMGAKPQTALAIATIPYGSQRYQRNLLYQLLMGSVQVLQQAGATLVGGHTTEGSELAFGLSCQGLTQPDRILRKNGLQRGDVLILTQALGTGVLFAGQMQGQVKGRWIDSALAAMLHSNQAAGQLAQALQASACTDITGFGLAGHLWEMVSASQVTVTLQLPSLPVLPGAIALSQVGVRSSLYEQNAEVQRFIQTSESTKQHSLWPLLFDPQTSGGLLIAVPADQAETCLTQLKAAGYPDSCAIAQVTAVSDSPLITVTV